MTQGRITKQFAKRAVERATSARDRYLAFDQGVARWSDEQVDVFAHHVYQECVEALVQARRQAKETSGSDTSSDVVNDLQRAVQDSHAVCDAILQQKIAPLTDCTEEEARQRQLQWASWPPDIRLTLGTP